MRKINHRDVINFVNNFKLEWLHSQVQELKNGVEVDLDTMLEVIEELREERNNNEKYKC